MTRRVSVNTICLECLAFMITMLLAASDVEGRDGERERTRETSGVVGRAASYNSHSLCYNDQKQEVNCSKKKGIIIGSVIGTLSVLMGALFLYATWSERRKKRKEFSTAEENEPLGDESRIISDCEKGVIKASKDKNKYDDDRMIPSLPHLDKSDEASVSGASSVESGPPSYGYDRPPGLTETGPHQTPIAHPND